MREVVTLEPGDVLPGRGSVTGRLGIPEGGAVPTAVEELLAEAVELFRSLARPRALWEELSGEEFAEVYRGEGRNARPAPLEEVYPRADRLALFAATVGEGVSRRIGELFDGGRPALGFALDSVASEAADRAAEVVGGRYLEALRGEGAAGEGTRVLPYSPGYCGWHVSGQRALFRRLRPGEVGIRLNESCLMVPLKSVSGVLVAGPARVHVFRPVYDFCRRCEGRPCRARIAGVLRERGARAGGRGVRGSGKSGKGS